MPMKMQGLIRATCVAAVIAIILFVVSSGTKWLRHHPSVAAVSLGHTIHSIDLPMNGENQCEFITIGHYEIDAIGFDINNRRLSRLWKVGPDNVLCAALEGPGVLWRLVEHDGIVKATRTSQYDFAPEGFDIGTLRLPTASIRAASVGAFLVVDCKNKMLLIRKDGSGVEEYDCEHVCGVDVMNMALASWKNDSGVNCSVIFRDAYSGKILRRIALKDSIREAVVSNRGACVIKWTGEVTYGRLDEFPIVAKGVVIKSSLRDELARLNDEVLAVCEDDVIRLWDLRLDGGKYQSIRVGEGASALAIGGNGAFVFVGYLTGLVKVFPIGYRSE